MEKPDRIINLLFEGIRPSKIAVECGISEESVASQIIQAIQEHRIPRLQVLATLSKDLQNQIAMFFPAWIKKPHTFSPEFIRAMSKASDDDFDLSEDDILVYLVCFEKPFSDGEIYEALCDIERTLHEKTKMILMNKFGSHENGWWRKGVPENIRISTVQSRERDLEFVGDAPYSYTTLIHLKEIILKNWSGLFEYFLPSAVVKKHDAKKYFFKELDRLNAIRNKVMHPVRGSPPAEEEFFFVQEMQKNSMLRSGA